MEHKRDLEKRMERNVKHCVAKAFKIFFIVCIALLFALLIGYVVMWLWNWLMPELFGLGTIGYWQAVGLLILSKIIFGFGSGGPSKGSSKGKRWNKKRSKRCEPLRKDFEEWKLYDQFWKEEGATAYKDYVERNKEDEKEQ